MTDLKPRVFISHSGNDAELLAKLHTELTTAGHQPLVDRKHILRGVEFPDVIDKFVRTCDAAVFILTPRALELDHTWVRDEANQLRQKMIGPNFQAVPVFVGVRPRQLDASWEAAGLQKRNGIEATDPDEIAAAVVEALAPTLVRVRADHLVRALAGELGEIRDEDALQRATEPLGGWIPGMLPLEIARRLLQATPDQIAEVAGRVGLKEPEVGKAILRIALPHTWVDRRAARNICEAVATRRTTALNTAALETADAHMVTGWTGFPPWRLQKQGHPTQGELEAKSIEEAVRAQLDWRDGHGQYDLNPRGAAYRSVVRKGASKRVVFAYDCQRLDAVTLDAIETAASKRAAVMLLAPYEDWATVPVDVRARVVLLDPALDRDVEIRALNRLITAEDELEEQIENNKYYTGRRLRDT